MWLDAETLNCNSNSLHVLQCGHGDFGATNCGHAQDLAVVCCKLPYYILLTACAYIVSLSVSSSSVDLFKLQYLVLVHAQKTKACMSEN